MPVTREHIEVRFAAHQKWQVRVAHTDDWLDIPDVHQRSSLKARHAGREVLIAHGFTPERVERAEEAQPRSQKPVPTEASLAFEARVREAKHLANRAEYAAADDARARELVWALRRQLNAALNAVPPMHAAVIAALEAIEAHAKGRLR